MRDKKEKEQLSAKMKENDSKRYKTLRRKIQKR